MTAAVEGVSKQCQELAKALDESFNMMLALSSPSNRLKTSVHPTLGHPHERSRNRSTSLSMSLPVPKQHRYTNGADSTPPRKHSVSSRLVSPYFCKSLGNKCKDTRSPHFSSLGNIKSRASEKVSCIPFPPLDATSFGLVQEVLAHDPFRLLVAVIFLNKTRGHVALPVFYELMERYPTPIDLAAADLDGLVDIIRCLGLQHQRAAKCINLAKAWLERPPEKGRRYRLLHYPKKDDGKDIKVGEVINEDDQRVGWEIGRLPGVGAYAIDSWRIFCRDTLRGLPSGLPRVLTAEAEENELNKEWTRVLPLDKELRAYLRWRWLRNGWEWNAITGERKRADANVMASAIQGGVIYEGDKTDILVGQEEVDALEAVKNKPITETALKDVFDV